MSCWDGHDYDSATVLRRRQEEREREKPARAAAIRSALDRAFTGDVAAMWRSIELLAAEHDVTVKVDPATDFASRRKTAYGPPIRPESRWDDFASWLHELSHPLVGRCRGGDHEPTMIGRARCCLRCETDTWAKAEELVRPHVFNKQMHDSVRMYLHEYRDRITGPATAVEALDQQASTLHYASNFQKRRRLEWMRERQDRAMASLRRHA